MLERGSRGEGWATGGEDDRGNRREGGTDGWAEVAFSLSLAVSQSSPAVYPVVRFSMSFKHKLQPVSTSALLGLSSSLVSSSNSPLPFSVPLPYLFYAVVPFPPLPPSLCLHPPPHPACLPTVAPQVGNISFKQVKLMPCRLAITRFCQPVWTVFTNFVHTIFSLFCFYNILGCSCFRFIEGVLSTEWNKTCEWKKFFIDGICKKKKEMSYMFKILHFAL